MTKYNAILLEQMSYHKLIPKAFTLCQAALDSTWNDQLTEEYQRTDKLALEAMLYTEAKAGRKYTTPYDWSPQFSQAVQAFRFWKLKLKLYRKLYVCPPNC